MDGGGEPEGTFRERNRCRGRRGGVCEDDKVCALRTRECAMLRYVKDILSCHPLPTLSHRSSICNFFSSNGPSSLPHIRATCSFWVDTIKHMIEEYKDMKQGTSRSKLMYDYCSSRSSWQDKIVILQNVLDEGGDFEESMEKCYFLL